MRAVMTDVPASLLAERSRLGLDVRDEMWEGVLHMAPQPAFSHQELNSALGYVLYEPARRRRLVPVVEPGTYRADDDYRVPDLAFTPRSSASHRGIDGPPGFAVEIRSPGDETYDKLGFYAAIGLPELLVVDRDTRAVELFVVRDGALVPATADAGGWLRSAVLEVGFRTTDDARLAVDLGPETVVIPFLDDEP
jgi:Uma2 family endonuclease